MTSPAAAPVSPPASAPGLAGAGADPAQPSPLLRLWRILRRRQTVLFGIAVLVLVLLLALLAPVIAPYPPGAMHIAQRLHPPGAAHWFGTDEFGRDLFTRVIYGGRVSLAAGGLTVLISCAAGVILGVLAGFFRGLDGPVSKLIDAMMALPDILLAIALVSVLGASLTNVVVALGIVYAPRVARIVRASTLVIRELPYVEAARALGVPTHRILTRHVLRNLTSPIIVQGTFIFAYAILAEAALSFLGVGVSPETPSWGTIISNGQQYANQASWIMIFPGLAIVLSVFSLQMVGDALRDLLDPKLRKDL